MITEKKRKRASLIEGAKKIQALAKGESRDLTEDESTSVIASLDEADNLKIQIELTEKIENRISEATDDVETPATQRSAPTQPQATITVSEPNFLKDPNGGYDNPRKFMLDVIRAGRGQGVSERLRIRAVIGGDEQSTFSDPFGGFLVPEGFSPNLLKRPTEADPLAGRTTMIPMDSPTVKIPARVDSNHTSSVSGGLRVLRRAEADTVSPSRMQLEQVVLDATSLFGIAHATNELLTDSKISFVALIQQGFEDEMASVILKEKLRGTGAGEGLGVLNSAATVSVAKEAAQPADTIVYENIVNMRARSWGYNNAVWIANHDTYPELAKMQLTVGTGGSAAWQPSLIPDRPDMILGRPVFFSEFAETLGDKGDLYLINASQILEGVLQPMQTDQTTLVRWENHESSFKVFMRHDVRPWWNAALTPNKSSKTLSPYVVLAARA